MKEKSVDCPVCKKGQAVRHCATNARCHWLKCLSETCGVTIGFRWTGTRWEHNRFFQPIPEK